MSLAGTLFICFLIFAFTWTYTKSPLIALGVAGVFWSVLHFFVERSDNLKEQRYEQHYGRPVEDKPNNNIFRHSDE